MGWLFEKLGVHSKEELWALAVQFVKFGLVGVSNTAVSFGCYYLVLAINPDHYLLGGLVGGVLSIANAFFWNDRFVFQSQNQDWKSKLRRLGKTYVSYGGSSLLGMALLWGQVQFLGVSKAIAPVVNLFITIPLNFAVNKLWTFGGEKSSEKPHLQTGTRNRNSAGRKE